MKFQKSADSLLVDRRWEGNTGIGRYSRELLPKISSFTAGYLSYGNPVSIKQMGVSIIRAQHFAKFYSPGYVPILGLKRQLVTIHDLILLEPEIGSNSKQIFFNRIVLPRIKDGTVRVVTVSKSSQEQIADWASIEKENISIVPNGLSAEIIEFAGKACINRVERTLVFVGNMKKHKNFWLFAEAVNLLPGSWTIRLVGPGLNVGLIDARHQVQSYWNISDSELAHIYANSSILVNTSSFEGFGMSFLEGGYLGCKIVHLGVLPTVVDILGKDTFHTRGSFSAKDLADLILEVNSMPESHNVREFLARDYSWEKSGKILSEILGTV